MRRLVASASLLALLGTGCSSAAEDATPRASTTTTAAVEVTTTSSTTTTTAPRPLRTEPWAVGRTTLTLEDLDRPTRPSGDFGGAASRTIPVIVFYPVDATASEEVLEEATPANGPFPLVVWSHGLGGTPEFARRVLTSWASAGLVVAAPRFPLSRPDAPGGPDAGDVQNQTGDVSFVIDELLAHSDSDQTLLSGLVDGERTGAAGHSNGGITTLGVGVHECCRDERLDAIIEMAGVAGTFDGGAYAWADAPPLLVVHGTDDALVRYVEGIRVFNDAVGPKGLLSIEGGNHGGQLTASGLGHEVTTSVSTDFFRAYLHDDADALDRLANHDGGPDAELVWRPDAGDTTTLPVPDLGVLDRVASVSESTGLVDGQLVTVDWSGFTPGGTVNVVQCGAGGVGGAAACDLATGHVLRPNPTGAGAVDLEIVVGAVGTATCAAGVDDCVIIVNDSGLSDPEATILIPLEFALLP